MKRVGSGSAIHERKATASGGVDVLSRSRFAFRSVLGVALSERSSSTQVVPEHSCDWKPSLTLAIWLQPSLWVVEQDSLLVNSMCVDPESSWQRMTRPCPINSMIAWEMRIAQVRCFFVRVLNIEFDGIPCV